MFQGELALFTAYYSADDAPAWLSRSANVSAVRAWRQALSNATADASDQGLLISPAEATLLLGSQFDTYVSTAHRQRFISRWNNGQWGGLWHSSGLRVGGLGMEV